MARFLERRFFPSPQNGHEGRTDLSSRCYMPPAANAKPAEAKRLRAMTAWTFDNGDERGIAVDQLAPDAWAGYESVNKRWEMAEFDHRYISLRFRSRFYARGAIFFAQSATNVVAQVARLFTVGFMLRS